MCGRDTTVAAQAITTFYRFRVKVNLAHMESMLTRKAIKPRDIRVLEWMGGKSAKAETNSPRLCLILLVAPQGFEPNQQIMRWSE